MKSIFTAKDKQPDDHALQDALRDTYALWLQLKAHVMASYPAATEQWSYSFHGWSFRLSDKKRVIIYLLPRDGYFKAAFVFGQKATDTIMDSAVASAIKDELNAAKVYAEGRGIRVAMTDATLISDIQILIAIKLAN